MEAVEGSHELLRPKTLYGRLSANDCGRVKLSLDISQGLKNSGKPNHFLLIESDDLDFNMHTVETLNIVVVVIELIRETRILPFLTGCVLVLGHDGGKNHESGACSLEYLNAQCSRCTCRP